jgi:phage tail tape-measure protein
MKGLIYLGIGVGGAIGSYVPALFGQDMISVASIIGGLVGSIAGLWAGYKLGTNI